MSTKAENNAKTCLLDGTKNNCNVASPTEACKSLIDCVLNDSSVSLVTIAHMALQCIKENYMLPSIVVALLLMVNLTQQPTPIPPKPKE